MTLAQQLMPQQDLYAYAPRTIQQEIDSTAIDHSYDYASFHQPHPRMPVIDGEAEARRVRANELGGGTAPMVHSKPDLVTFDPLTGSLTIKPTTPSLLMTDYTLPPPSLWTLSETEIKLKRKEAKIRQFMDGPITVAKPHRSRNPDYFVEHVAVAENGDAVKAYLGPSGVDWGLQPSGTSHRDYTKQFGEEILRLINLNTSRRE